MASRRPAWIDITIPMGAPGAAWPGDAPFTIEPTQRVGVGGASTNLTRFSSSPHNGTHSDAPFHVDSGGPRSEALELDAFLGPCRVIDGRGKATSELGPGLIAGLGKIERVLFRTRAERTTARRPSEHRWIGADLADELAKHRMKLVGTDAASVDPASSLGLPVHKRLLRAGVTLLESLDLSRAAPGDYDLVALPLKVHGLCAAPVRAILVPRRPPRG